MEKQEIHKDPSGGDGDKAPVTTEVLTKLQEQVANLTKGIAGYRDTAQEALKAAKDANEALEAIKKSGGKNDKEEDEVELNADDEKKFKSWASKQGFLTSEDMQKERQRLAADSAKEVSSTAVSEFLEKHPEYDDDDKWKAVQEEFNLYKTPADLASYRALLERVHKSLSGGKKDTARAEARAEINNRSRLSLGGGHGGGSSASDDNSVESLQKRYPNLSRDQIERRVAELKALYPDKK